MVMAYIQEAIDRVIWKAGKAIASSSLRSFELYSNEMKKCHHRRLKWKQFSRTDYVDTGVDTDFEESDLTKTGINSEISVETFDPQIPSAGN
jgi:hypothetical protein